MKILITNDDGIDSPGLAALAIRLSRAAEVTVVAPSGDRSGTSQSVTIHEVLREPEEKHIGDFKAYSLDGTPADCVKFALGVLLPEKPDAVISGINKGPNNASNVFYSGTVGGASEGAINGVPSMAVSIAEYHYGEYEAAAGIAEKLLPFVAGKGRPENALYNVNVPALPPDRIRGVKTVKLSPHVYLKKYKKCSDPFGKPYYWIDGFTFPDSADPESDDAALAEGYVSVTPLLVDRTDYALLKDLKELENLKCF